MALTKPKLSQNIDTDISVFSDPILVLHQGSSLADVDVGFLMNRSNGLTANAAVIWQESSKSFVHILTTSSGVADANLTVQSYANVSVGNVLLINNAGIYVDGTLGTAGQVLASDGSKSYWAAPGGFTGGTVSGATVFESNLVVSNTTTSTSNVTGALVVRGGAGIAGNLYVSNISVGSGNIQFAQKSGMISGATAYLSLLGNPSGSAGISALELAGYTGIAGGTQSRLDFVSKVSNVFYNTSRISSINGPSSTGAGQLVFSTTPDGGSLTERLRIKDDGPIVTAANIVAVGSATSNTTTGAIVVVGGIGLSGGIIAGGNIVAAAVTNSVSTTTGALVVRGGAGIAGNVYANVFYTLDGIRWAGNGAVFASGGGGGGNTYTANTAPPTSGNVAGDMWYDTNADILYEYLDDGSTKYWVDVQSLGQTGNIVSMVDTTLSGNIVVGLSNVYSIGTSTGYIRNIFANTITANGITSTGNVVIAATTTSTSTTTGALVVNGGAGFAANIFTAGWIIPSSNVSQNLGTTTNWWNLIYGRSVQAQYADLAENYLADQQYEPGTAVIFGGVKEITTTDVSHDTRVAGVISTNPGYLMNAAAAGLPVALQGRVPCRVKGPVSQGDLVVTSDIPGVACKLDPFKFEHGCLIGKSLESIDDKSIRTIEVVVGRY